MHIRTATTPATTVTIRRAYRLVASEGTRGAAYRVDLDRATGTPIRCTCADHYYRNRTCKHMARVLHGDVPGKLHLVVRPVAVNRRAA